MVVGPNSKRWTYGCDPFIRVAHWFSTGIMLVKWCCFIMLNMPMSAVSVENLWFLFSIIWIICTRIQFTTPTMLGVGGKNTPLLSLLLHNITQPLTYSLLLKGEWEVRGWHRATNFARMPFGLFTVTSVIWVDLACSILSWHDRCCNIHGTIIAWPSWR